MRAKGVQHLCTEANFALLDQMDGIAQAHNATVSQVALAWLLADPLVTSPIIGPNRLEQLHDNLGALSVHLTDEERTRLNQATDWREK